MWFCWNFGWWFVVLYCYEVYNSVVNLFAFVVNLYSLFCLFYDFILLVWLLGWLVVVWLLVDDCFRLFVWCFVYFVFGVCGRFVGCFGGGLHNSVGNFYNSSLCVLIELFVIVFIAWFCAILLFCVWFEFGLCVCFYVMIAMAIDGFGFAYLWFLLLVALVFYLFYVGLL